MNKYQEALNVYKSLEGFKQGVLIPCNPMKFYEAEKTLQQLVDKETPKKPIKKIISNEYDFENYDYCPCCGEVSGSYQKYCDKCGQALDWSDE